MFKLFAVTIALPLLALASPTPFRSCPNGAPTPETFEVDGCTALPCTITRGEPMRAVGRNIISPVSTSTVEASINFYLAGLDLGVPTPPEIVDACAVGIDSCPLVAGQSFDYTFEDSSIDMEVGGITVTIRVALQDGDTPIGCIEFDGTVV